VGHAGDAVVFVAVVPGLNGSPSELARVALLIEKGHGGDLVDPLVPGSALDRVDGSQDSHLQIDRWLLHGVLLAWGMVDRKKRCPRSDRIKKRQLVLSPIFDEIVSAKRDRNSVTIGVDRGRWQAMPSPIGTLVGIASVKVRSFRRKLASESHDNQQSGREKAALHKERPQGVLEGGDGTVRLGKGGLEMS